MQLTKEYKGVWSRHREPPELKAQERVDAILADIQTAAALNTLREHEAPADPVVREGEAVADVPCRFCKRKAHWDKNPMLLCDHPPRVSVFRRAFRGTLGFLWTISGKLARHRTPVFPSHRLLHTSF
jgi:hypothetical protein